MCLAFPMRVEETDGRTARVAWQKQSKNVDVSMLKGVRKGDYVLAHGSLAIQKLDRKDANETIALIEETCGCADQADPP